MIFCSMNNSFSLISFDILKKGVTFASRKNYLSNLRI